MVVFYTFPMSKNPNFTHIGNKRKGVRLEESVLNLGFNYLNVKTISNEAGYETEPMHKDIFDR